MKDGLGKRLWLALLPIGLCGFDGVITLVGQPSAYWRGDYGAIRESNPLAAWFLSWHPLAFVASGIPYAIVLTAVIWWLPRPWAWAFSCAVAVAHALAVCVWTMVLFQESLGYGVLLFPGSMAALAMIWWACRPRSSAGRPLPTA